MSPASVVANCKIAIIIVRVIIAKFKIAMMMVMVSTAIYKIAIISIALFTDFAAAIIAIPILAIRKVAMSVGKDAAYVVFASELH